MIRTSFFAVLFSLCTSVAFAATAPSITTQPAAKTATAGQSASFTVVATGTAPLSYQWMKSGTNISGATGATYTISSTTTASTGSYTVAVSNSAGSKTSNAATLTVNVTPAITTQPTSQTVTAGQSVSFTVVATGTPAPTYQWKKNGTAISGATSATYTIASTTTSSAGTYTVTVTNTAGSVTSSNAVLTVNAAAAPKITTQPSSQTVTAGQSVSFTVVATGTPTPTYQWKKGTSSISGATSATYTITSTTTSSAGTYTVAVSNSAGSVTSSNAVLTVNAAVAPTITTQPLSQTVNAGQSVSFSVVATGSPTLTYQWKLGGTAINGATSATYTISSPTTASAGIYTVVVTNSAGSKTSNNATLTVNAVVGPSITTQPTSKSVTVGQSASFTVVASGTAPLTYQWKKNNTAISGATSATYTIASVGVGDAASYTVTITNSAGSVTSNAAVLTVNAANQSPVVTLTAPAANAAFTLPATITLTATASDPDGTVTKVEFFNGTTSLGTVTTPTPANSTFYILNSTFSSTPGFASLTAVATDNGSPAATGTSPAVSITLLPSLPYISHFETTEGYTSGSLNNQQGWSVTAGTAQIAASGAYDGTQGVVLNSGSTAAQIDQEFGSTGTNPPIVFIDFSAKPVAGADTTAGTLFDVDAARVAFVLNGASGRLVALDGDGLGAGSWKTLTPAIALSTGNVAAAWQRLTVRLNYTTKTYDLYLNGVMIAADLKFRLSGAAYVSWFSLKGATTASASFDNLYAGPINPLFVDTNNDGLPDDLSRTGDYDHDGVSDLQEVLLGMNPRNSDTDGDGMSDGWEVKYGLNSLANDANAPDACGDGLTNLQAYKLGRNPTKVGIADTTSAVRLQLFQPRN
jgi:hypothetical protein